MNFLIREFPEELHKALKMMAVKEGKPLYRLIIEILEKYLKKQEKES